MFSESPGALNKHGQKRMLPSASSAYLLALE